MDLLLEWKFETIKNKNFLNYIPDGVILIGHMKKVNTHSATYEHDEQDDDANRVQNAVSSSDVWQMKSL